MNRSRVIASAVFLAFIGAVLPLALMAYVSWMFAMAQEQQRLEAYSVRALKNLTLSLDQGKQALQAMATWRGVACSPQHVAEMRRRAVNTRTVEEIGYFEGGVLRCSSWGVTDIVVPEGKPEFTTPDGFGMTLRVTPSITRGDPATVLRLGAYNVLINASRLSDVIVEDGVQLGVVYAGRLISELGSPETARVLRIAASGVSGHDATSLHAVAQQDGWSAVVVQPRTSLSTSLAKELLWMLPIGVLIGGFIVWLVVHFSRKRLSPLAELGIAVARREFVVHYQPLIDLQTGACIGAEALVRWRRPDGSLVRPDLFVPLAEESGLILPITDQVMQAVVRDLRTVLAQDRTLHVAINLCADDIQTGRFLAPLQRALQGADIHHDQIWLEATERGFIQVEAACATLRKARALGFGIAIDDFGTGYSSLQYLEKLPTDALKIDKSFIDAIGTTSAPSSVTSHIIAMAKTLGLRIVAEGVETEEQARYLRELQVDYAQGWLYAKALPASDFIDFLTSAADA